MHVDAVKWLSSDKGKTSTSPSGGCFTCDGAHYHATAMHAKARASNRLAKTRRVASHGPRVSAKEKEMKKKGKQGNNQRIVLRCQGSETFEQRYRLHNGLVRP